MPLLSRASSRGLGFPSGLAERSRWKLSSKAAGNLVGQPVDFRPSIR